MQRIIKFRSWHTEMKQMLEEPFDGEYLSETTDLNSVIRGCQNDEHQILMQFTGLKDKNGKDIYESDIVKFPSFGDLYEVKYDYAYFHPFEAARAENCEVLGNIYETPKLLKYV